jgi:two-component system sensor histidine kinase UhpB
LPDETETHLFRIAQEALTNVARHSGATRVWVKLESRGGEVCLSIRDNGKGLSGARREGMGLIGMRARARSAGGDVTVDSRGGVRIEARIPVISREHEPENPRPVG